MLTGALVDCDHTGGVRLSSWQAAVSALIIVVVALVPALALRSVSATGDESAQGSTAEQPGRGLRAPLDALMGRGGPDRDAQASLRTLTTAPRPPRLADDDATVRAEQRIRNPRLRIDAPAPDALGTTMATPGVHWATDFRVAELPVEGRAEARQMRVGFVDPRGFRVFTPGVTARSETLWAALGADEAIVSFEAAHHLSIRAGDTVEIGASGRRARVAGVASFGHADVADVLLRPAAASDFDVDITAGLLVGLDRLGELDQVRGRLEAAGVGDISVVDADAPYRAELVGGAPEVVEAFEPFTFRHPGEGQLDIDPAWLQRNIVETSVPVLGTVRCHRLIIPQLRAALEEIVELELDHLLDPDDFGGCWVPRHIGFNETRPLSMHAWGIAFDVNVDTNPYGSPPQLDKRIVEVFDRHGFGWGGDWRTPDGMHFELREFTEPPSG